MDFVTLLFSIIVGAVIVLLIYLCTKEQLGLDRYLHLSASGDDMGVTTVIKDYGTEILNAIRENNLQRLKQILEKHLGSEKKIEKLCTSDIKHKPSKKFACPLILAARQDDPRILKYMLDKGVDPNFVHHTIFSSKRREVVTPLHIAVDLQYYDSVEVLLAANADCNIGDHNQETPLHIAIKKADSIMTRMLLSNGADPSMPDRHGNPTLHIATAYGHLQLVRSLLKYDADVYQKGQWGAIPPHIAAKEGHIHLIQLFCSRDIGNINIKIPCYTDQREKAPIHLAAEHGHVETVLALLDQFDAEVNLKDSDGNTPLHNAVLNQYNPRRMRDKEYFNETARVLVKYHVAINEKNIFGDTALHLAAMNQFQRIVEMLLDVGANPFIENEEGLKPIDVVPDTDPVTKNVLKDAMLHPRRSMDHLADQSSDRSSLMHNGHEHSSSQGSQEFNPDESFVTTSSLSSVFDNKNQKRPLPGVHGKPHQGPVSSNGQPPQKQPKVNATKEQTKEQKKPEGPVYTKVDKKGREQPPQLAQIVNNVGPPPNSPPSNMPVVPPPPVNPPPPLTPQDKPEAFSTFRGPNARYKDTSAVIHQTKPIADPRQGQAGMSMHPGDDLHNQPTQVINKRGIPSSQVRGQSGPYAQPIQPSQRHGHYVQPDQQSQYVLPGQQRAVNPYEQGLLIDPQTGRPSNISQTQSTGVQAQTTVGNIQTQTSLDNQGKAEYANLSEEIQARINKRNQMTDANMNTEEPEPAQGIHVQTVPGKPGTIEVRYDGGPITISVDTQGNYEPTEGSESQYSNQYQTEQRDDTFNDQYTEEFSEGPSMEIIEDAKGVDGRPNASYNTSFDSSEDPYQNLPPEPDVTNAIRDRVISLTEPVPAPRPRKSTPTEHAEQQIQTKVPVPAPKFKRPVTLKHVERKEEEMDEDYTPDESPNGTPKHKSYGQISQMWKNRDAKAQGQPVEDVVRTSESNQWKVEQGHAVTVTQDEILTQDDTLEASHDDITESTIDMDEHAPPSPVMQKAKTHPQDSHELYYSITQQEARGGETAQQPFVHDRNKNKEEHRSKPQGRFEESQQKPEVIYANLEQMREKQKKDSDMIPYNEETISAQKPNTENLPPEAGKPPAHAESLDSLGSWDGDDDDRRTGPQIYMRVTGDTPQAKTRRMNHAARTAFMKAAPAIVESSSEASDTEFGSRTSFVSDASAQLRWKEDLKQYYQKSDKEKKEKKEDESEDNKKPNKKMIGLPKPYKSFGKIEVETGALVPGVGLVGDEEFDDEPFEPKELPRLGSFSSSTNADVKGYSQTQVKQGKEDEAIRYANEQSEEFMDDTSEVSSITDPASSIDYPIMNLTGEPKGRGVPQRPQLPGKQTGLPQSMLKHPVLQQVANEDNILSVSMESSEFDEDAELLGFNESPLSTVEEQSPEPTSTILSQEKILVTVPKPGIQSPGKRPTDRAPSPPSKKPGTASDKPKPALKPKPGQPGGTPSPAAHGSSGSQKKVGDTHQISQVPQQKPSEELNVDNPQAGRRGHKPSVGPKPTVAPKPTTPSKPKEKEATFTPEETTVDNMEKVIAGGIIGAAISQQSPRHQQRINRQSVETCIDDVMESVPPQLPPKASPIGSPRKSTPSPIRSSPPVNMGVPGKSAFTPPQQKKVFPQDVPLNDSEDDEVAFISQTAQDRKEKKGHSKAQKILPGQHVYVNLPAHRQQPPQGYPGQQIQQDPVVPANQYHDEGFHPKSPPGGGAQIGSHAKKAGNQESKQLPGQFNEEFSDPRYQNKAPIEQVQEEFSDPRYRHADPMQQVQEEFSDPRYQRRTTGQHVQEEFSDPRYQKQPIQQYQDEFSDPRYQQNNLNNEKFNDPRYQAHSAQQDTPSKPETESKEKKGGFFKLPSIRKKKRKKGEPQETNLDDSMASTGSGAEEMEISQNLTTNAVVSEVWREAASDQPLASSESFELPVQHHGEPEADYDRQKSAEELGIAGTHFGKPDIKVKRQDTVVKKDEAKPEVKKKSGFFNIGSKRKKDKAKHDKAEDVSLDSSGDVPVVKAMETDIDADLATGAGGLQKELDKYKESWKEQQTNEMQVQPGMYPGQHPSHPRGMLPRQWRPGMQQGPYQQPMHPGMRPPNSQPYGSPYGPQGHMPRQIRPGGPRMIQPYDDAQQPNMTQQLSGPDEIRSQPAQPDVRQATTSVSSADEAAIAGVLAAQSGQPMSKAAQKRQAQRQKKKQDGQHEETAGIVGQMFQQQHEGPETASESEDQHAQHTQQGHLPEGYYYPQPEHQPYHGPRGPSGMQRPIRPGQYYQGMPQQTFKGAPTGQEQGPAQTVSQASGQKEPEKNKLTRDDSTSSVEDAVISTALPGQTGERQISKSALKRQAQREKMKKAGKPEETAGIVGEMFQQQQQKDTPELGSESDDQQVPTQPQMAGQPVVPEGYYYPQQPGIQQPYYGPRGQAGMQRPVRPGQYYQGMPQQMYQGHPQGQPFPGQVTQPHVPQPEKQTYIDQKPTTTEDQDLEDRKFKRGDSISSVSSFEDAALATVLGAQSGDTPKSKALLKRQAQREKMKKAGKPKETAGIVGQMFQQQQQRDAHELGSESDDQQVPTQPQMAGQPVVPEGYYYPQQPGIQQPYYGPRGQAGMQRPVRPGQYYQGMPQQMYQGHPQGQPFPGQVIQPNVPRPERPNYIDQKPTTTDDQALEDRKFKRGDSISSVSSFEDAALASVLAAQSGDTQKSQAALKRQAQRDKMRKAGKPDDTTGIVGQMFQQQQNDAPVQAQEEQPGGKVQLGPDGQPIGGEIPGYYYQQQMQPPYGGEPRMQRPVGAVQYQSGDHYPPMQQGVPRPHYAPAQDSHPRMSSHGPQPIEQIPQPPQDIQSESPQQIKRADSISSVSSIDEPMTGPKTMSKAEQKRRSQRVKLKKAKDDATAGLVGEMFQQQQQPGKPVVDQQVEGKPGQSHGQPVSPTLQQGQPSLDQQGHPLGHPGQYGHPAPHKAPYGIPGQYHPGMPQHIQPGQPRGQYYPQADQLPQAPHTVPAPALEDAAMAAVTGGLQQEKKDPEPVQQLQQFTIPQHQPQQGYDIQGLTGPRDHSRQDSTGSADASLISSMWKDKQDQEAEMNRMLQMVNDPGLANGDSQGHSQPQAGQFYQRPRQPGQPYTQRYSGHPFPRQQYPGQPIRGQMYPGQPFPGHPPPRQGISPMLDITNQQQVHKPESILSNEKTEVPKEEENKENADVPKEQKPHKRRTKPKKIVAYPQPGVRVKIYRPEPILAAGGTTKAGNSPTTSLATNDIDLLHKMWAAQAQGIPVTPSDAERMAEDGETDDKASRRRRRHPVPDVAVSDSEALTRSRKGDIPQGAHSEAELDPSGGRLPYMSLDDMALHAGKPPPKSRKVGDDSQQRSRHYYRGRPGGGAPGGQYGDSAFLGPPSWGPHYRSGTESDADNSDMNFDDSLSREGSFRHGGRSAGSLPFPPPGTPGSGPGGPLKHSSPEEQQLMNTSAPPAMFRRDGSFYGPPPHLRRRRPGRRYRQPDMPPSIIDSGPVDFTKFGVTAQLWMEQVDKKTVERSKSMSLTVTGSDQNLPESLKNRFPKEEDDDVFLPPQWVIARGRRGAPLFSEQNRSFGAASDSDGEGKISRPMSPGRQMLLFFKVGNNWRYLAWVLFDEILTDAEIIRMVKDIQLKHPGELTEQVHDLMQRWWKKLGSSATIEELRYALEFVNMAYIQEEHYDQRSSITSFTDTEDELDIDEISEKDPNVSRLIDEYDLRSINNSFELNPTGSHPSSRPSSRASSRPSSRGPSMGAFNSDSLAGRLNSLSRSSGFLPVGDRGGSLGKDRSETGLYNSDFEDSHLMDESFKIVQPDAKKPPKETNL